MAMRKPLLIGALVLLALLLGAGLLAVRLVTPRTQGAIATWLVDQFGGRAAIDEVRWSLRPALRIAASGVRVWTGETQDQDPLVVIEHVLLETTIQDLRATPRRVRLVELQGLVVRVPPRKRPGAGSTPRDTTERPPGSSQAGAGGNPGARPAARIDRIVAKGTRVEIRSSRPDKPPLVFDVHDLTLSEVAPGQPMKYVARLTNPKPIGEVATEGTLGAWNKEDPGSTAIDGKFRFADADLGSLRGLEGILQSEGSYTGSIGEIHARGAADIAGFAVTGQPVPLATRYDVIVGGTTGDVVLQPVDVTVLESRLSSAGAIVRSRETKGRRIDMDVRAAQARIEDLLRLAIESEPPPLSGPIELETALRLEPGDAPVIRRLHLDGRFTMRRARFARTDIQKTLARVSRITGGGPVGGEAGSSVAANMTGRFTLDGGTLNLSTVSFTVPGTSVRLSGTYGIENGLLDLRGTVKVARSVADVAPSRVAGWIEALGRIDDRLKLDTSGTIIPITITGSREKPTFRVDVAALKKDWRKSIGIGR
jgi:hypothetical protein